MGDASRGIMNLRPVRFRYKKSLDPEGQLRYGLVAEEVTKVYPWLVGYDGDHQPLAVRYELLSPLLLNELQKQARQNAAQEEQLTYQARHIADQDRQIADLQQQLTALARQAKEQVDAVSARLVQVEAVLGAQGHLPPLEASNPGAGASGAARSRTRATHNDVLTLNTATNAGAARNMGENLCNGVTCP
jgi:hypothetical protein